MSWKTLLWPWGRVAELDADLRARKLEVANLVSEALRGHRKIGELAARNRSLEALLVAPLKEMTMRRVADELVREGVSKIRDTVMLQTAKLSDRRASVQVTVPLEAAMFLGDRRSWETSIGALVAEQWARRSVDRMRMGHPFELATSQDVCVLRITVPELHYRVVISLSGADVRACS